MRRAAAMLLVAVTLLAGCSAPAATPAPEAQRDAAPPPPPPEACARLSVVADEARLVHPRNTTVRVRFENCGHEPLLLDDDPCGGLAAPLLRGPVRGVLGRGAMHAGTPSCAHDPRAAPLVVPPRSSTERLYWWDGTMWGGCVLPRGVPPFACGAPEPAPPGAYVVEVTLLTADRLGAWTARAPLELRAWSDAREGWTHLHPSWRAGPGNFSWHRADGSNTTVRIDAGHLYATDGMTYLYVTRAGALDPPSFSDCRSEFRSGTWVVVKRPACLWMRHPTVACVEVAQWSCNAALSGRPSQETPDQPRR